MQFIVGNHELLHSGTVLANSRSTQHIGRRLKENKFEIQYIPLNRGSASLLAGSESTVNALPTNKLALSTKLHGMAWPFFG